MPIYAGLDVSDKATHICVVDVEGVVLRREVMASDPAILAKWLDRYCPDLVRVVMETGPLSTFLYHGMVARDVPIECICARHPKGVLSARVNKSDVHDAEGLAQMARTGWFKRIHMKALAMHFDRAAIRIRAQLITARTAMINQLRGLLKLFGLQLGSVRAPGKRTERLSVLHSQRPDLEALDDMLAEICREDERCKRMTTLPGVGPIVATSLVAAIDDGRHFASGRALSAWIGLVPRQYTTGGKPRLGGIGKRANHYLRRQLIHGARSALLRVAKHEDRRSKWAQELQLRAGHSKKLVVTANKTARVAWAMLRSGENYKMV